MTEPNKHRRRAEPKRAARPGRASRPQGARVKLPETPASPATPETSGGLTEEQAAQVREALGGGRRSARTGSGSRLPTVLAFWRSTPGLVAFAVVVIALAFGVRVLVSGDDEEPAPRATVPGAVNATYGNQWTTVEGSTYEITVEPLSDLVQGASASGCLPAPPAGSANLHFRILITNKSDVEAGVPRVDFGTDLVRGEVDPARQTFATSNKAVVVDRPAVGATTCKEAARLGPDGRDKIPAGGVVEFTGTFGPIEVPARVVPTVVYRYFVDDNGRPKATELLAPFTRF